MNDSIQHLTTESLTSLSSNCSEVIEAVCKRLGQNEEAVLAIQRLMNSPNMLEAFLMLESSDPQTAKTVLTSAIATLVNSQSLLAIETELNRRSVENN